jgi:hypothetical protein
VAVAAALGAVLAAAQGGALLPAPAKAVKGGSCVEPVADMRRNHMLYLEHQRDETMRQGIRGRKYSLRACLDCHAAPDPAAGGARTEAPFCAECHRYAAVAIDCFECHARKPAEARKAETGTPGLPAGLFPATAPLPRPVEGRGQ